MIWRLALESKPLFAICGIYPVGDEDSSDSILDFPCEFPIKAMGLAQDNFDALVVEIVMRHVGGLTEGAVSVRESREGKYVSVTVVFEATDRPQLDGLYRELSGHERVLMVL